MSYSGYGDWNSGASRGYEGYGYGYGYGQEAAGSYGYGLATPSSWDVANSDPDGNPEGSGDLAAKMSQRLELGPHGEPEAVPGGHYGAAGDRFDSYDPYDSRSSASDRDSFRPHYDYPEGEGEGDTSYEGPYEGPYEPFYPSRRDPFQPRPRDGFGQQRGHGWGRDGRGAARPPTPSYPGRAGGQWNEHPQAVGGRGLGPHGPSRLPSLFSHNILPEAGMFPGARGFVRYGGGMMKQRMRRNWKVWDSDFTPQRKKLKRDPGSKKQKPPSSSEEPDGKAAKTDGSDNSDSDNEEGTEGESGEKDEKEGSRGEGEDEEGRDPEKGALTLQEEISQIQRKLQAGRKSQDRQKKRHRDRMVERIQFVCSLCKYRTFYEDEMSSHLESKFHKEHFKFVGTKLPQQTADFLQEYVANKTRKTEQRRRGVDLNAVIQQIYRDQDLTQEVGMEHFIKKVEAAHCAACDLFIPMQFGIIQKHLKSLDHNHNRRAMMEQSKRSSLVVARSILNNKLISKKLERYLKGENPFTDDPEEKEEQEEGEGGTGANAEEGTAENKDEEENPEENPQEENPKENPQEGNPEEDPQEENPQQGNLQEENPQEGNALGENPAANPQGKNPEEENPGEENSEAAPEEETRDPKEPPEAGSGGGEAGTEGEGGAPGEPPGQQQDEEQAEEEEEEGAAVEQEAAE